MGHVDTTLLYNGFNSYVLEAGEVLWGNTFDVNLYSHISLQFVTIRLDGTASVRFNVRWIGEDNKRLGVADTQIPFDVTNRWSRKTATLKVPEEAFKVTISIENTSGSDFHISCPMSEAGEIATAFDPALASKVAWHDANGSYVGFLRADQIVAGVLRSIVGDSGFDLEAPEIWMKSTDGEITWKASPENPFELTDGDGKVLGGFALVGGMLQTIAGSITNDPDSGRYATVGTWNMPKVIVDQYGTEINARTLTGIMFFDTAYSTTIPIMALGTSRFELYGVTEEWFEVSLGGEAAMIANSNQTIFAQEKMTTMLSGSGDSQCGINIALDAHDGDLIQSFDINTYPGMSPNGMVHLSSGTCALFMLTDDDIEDYVELSTPSSSLYVGEDFAEMGLQSSDWPALGVDENGAYYTSGAGKVYLHPQTIAGAQNFNNYTTAGTWYFTGSGHTSGPVTTAGFLRVTGTAGAFILQEYFSGTNMYTRRYTSSWNAWTAR